MDNLRLQARVNVKLLVIVGLVGVLLTAGLAGGYKLRKRTIANRALAAGNAAFEAGNWLEAVQNLRQYLSRYSNDLPVLERYARASLEARPQTRELRKGAIEAYRRYLRLRPADPAITRSLGRLYIANGEFNEAAYVYEKRRAAAPDDADALLGLTRALFLQRKHAETVNGPNAPLRALLRLHPDKPEGYILLSSLVEKDAPSAVADAAREVLNAAATQTRPAAQPARATAAATRPAVALDSPTQLRQALLDAGIQRNPRSAELLVERARFLRTSSRGGAGRAASMEQAHRDLESADAIGSTDPDVLFQLLDEWYEPAYVSVVPDHLDRAAAELDKIAALDAAALARTDRKPEDLKLPRLLGAAKLAIRRGTPAEKAEVARRGRSELVADDLRKFLPMAARLYLSAGLVEEAEAVAGEYERATQYMLGVNPAIQDSKILMRASIDYVKGDWYAVIARLEPITAAGPREGLSDALGLLLASYAATAQHRRLIERLGSEGSAWQDDPSVLRPAFASCMATGRWSDAERYAAMLEQAERSDEAMLMRIRATVQASEGRVSPTEAQRLLKELAALRKHHPGSAEVRLVEAQLAFNTGRREEAVQILQQAVQECPDTAPLHLRLSEYCRRMERREQAIESCRAAIDAAPSTAAPRIALARLLAEENQDEARLVLEQGVEDLSRLERPATQPSGAMVRDERAALLHELALHWVARDERDRGAALLRRMLADRSNDLAAHVELIHLLDPREDRAEIERLIAGMKAVEKEQGIRWRLEQALFWMSQFREIGVSAAERQRLARQIEGELKRCIESDPGWEEPVVVLGSLREELGEDARAEELYRQWLKARPDNAAVTDRLLTLLKRQKRGSDISIVLKGMPESRQGEVLRRLYAPIAHVGTGDYEAAITQLEQTVKANARDVPARVLLAALYQTHRRDGQKALQLLDEGLRIEPDFFDAFAAKIAVLNALGRNEEALRLLDEQVRRRNDFESYKLRASLHTAMGHPEQAEQDLLKLPTFSGRAAEGWALLGSFYQSRAQLDRAIAAWEKGLRADAQNEEVAYQLIGALASHPQAESRQRGRELLDARLADKPGDANLLLARARYLLAEGGEENRRSARAALERAVRSDPRNVAAQLELISLGKGPAGRHLEPAETREQISQALGANRGNVALLLALAEFEASTANPRAAVAAAQAAADADPRHLEAQNTATLAALEADQLETAEKFNQQALRLNPAGERAVVLRARILQARGRADEAVKMLEANLAEGGGVPRVPLLLMLAELHQQAQRHAEAGARLEQAEKLAPRDPDVIIARLAWLAARGRHAEIRPAAEAGLNGAEGDVRILVAAGSLLATAGQSHAVDAVALYERALALEADQPEALNNIAWLLAMELDQAEQALSRYANRAVQLYPGDPHILETRGAILARLGRYEQARADLEKCLLLATRLPATRCSALRGLGRVYKELKKPAQARESLLEAKGIDREAQVMSDRQRAEVEQLLASIRMP